MSDVFNEVGSLALGSRLRRLSETLMGDGAAIYRVAGEEFKPAWFPLYYELLNRGPAPIGEIAQRLGVSHVALIQVMTDLEREGLAESKRNPGDARKRMVQLTQKGQEKSSQLLEIWACIRAGIDSAIWDSGYDLTAALAGLERALDKRPFAKRFEDEWFRVDIVPFEDKYAKDYRDLNLEWISKYFVVEAFDAAMLEDPYTYVLKDGGAILMAVEARTGKAVGTAALMHHDGDWELAKMGVSPVAHGRGIGRKLGNAIIDLARARGISRLVLETNKRLAPAIKLYESLGFVHTPKTSPSDYQRADVYMILSL